MAWRIDFECFFFKKRSFLCLDYNILSAITVATVENIILGAWIAPETLILYVPDDLQLCYTSQTGHVKR